MKIRLIWDDCTPTRDRRPTTAQDIEDDIHVRDFSSKKEFADFILNMLDYNDPYALDDLEGDSMFQKALTAMSYCDDPGDGSPNFLYMSINGKEYDTVTYIYDCMQTLDLEHCSEEDVKEVLKHQYTFITYPMVLEACGGDEKAAQILMGWLDYENALGDDPDDVLETFNLMDLLDAASDVREKEIVAKALAKGPLEVNYPLNDEDDE